MEKLLTVDLTQACTILFNHFISLQNSLKIAIVKEEFFLWRKLKFYQKIPKFLHLNKGFENSDFIQESENLNPC